MTEQKATAGNQGAKIRSDCFVTLELTSSGGIQLTLQSKVTALYGKSIDRLCREVLAFFKIENAVLSVIDQGALPFVIAARIEAAIRKLKNVRGEFLPPILVENQYHTDRSRDRISRLYLPGNTPSLMINAGIHGAGGIILDLEDAVAPDKKEEAKILVRNALCAVDFMGAERMVRINP
jgi:citrate lyase subunit beta/citryl-CoA lyase